MGSMESIVTLYNYSAVRRGSSGSTVYRNTFQIDTGPVCFRVTARVVTGGVSSSCFLFVVCVFTLFLCCF